MAREPYLAIFKTAHGSLVCRQILADLLQSIAKQQILPLRLSKVTIDVLFSCYIARLAKLMSNYKILWSHATPMTSCMALMEIYSKHEAVMALSAKKVPDP